MTTTLEQVEGLLPMLSPGEKAQVARWVHDDLQYRFPGIEKRPAFAVAARASFGHEYPLGCWWRRGRRVQPSRIC